MSIKLICDNRKAFFNYEVLERFEAGLVLLGSEVKALRDAKVNLGDAYASFRGSELFLLQAHISAYQATAFSNLEPMRARKLLLHRAELEKMLGKTQEKGLSLIPLRMYFKEGKAKVELGLCKGKKLHDKRETLKRKQDDRQMARAMKSHK